MKIYIDLSCDKVNGQQHMQRALRDYCIEKDIYTEKDDADILVYVQVPFDENILDEWMKYKVQGKRIVFIHHYMSKSFYERCAIFKIEGLFDLIDYHVCISKDCELYDYLLSRKINKDRIFILELAASEYTQLYKKYFKQVYDKEVNSICFIGKAIKGVDKFVDYCNEYLFTKMYILCPDIEKCHKDLSKFIVYTNKRFDEVYEIMSKCTFIYCPSVYNTPPMHLETSLQEAIPCGCIPVVDDSYKEILKTKDIQKYGFVLQNEVNKYDLSTLQQSAIAFQKKNYLTLSQTLAKLVKYFQSIYLLLD